MKNSNTMDNKLSEMTYLLHVLSMKDSFLNSCVITGIFNTKPQPPGQTLYTSLYPWFKFSRKDSALHVPMADE